jgi:hypothetical protein
MNYGFIGGGQDNTILATSGSNAVIAGGGQNTADFGGSFVGGGYQNSALAFDVVVTGGNGNTATGGGSAIGGGEDNTTSGSGACVPGGVGNTASGSRSFAAGSNATASHANSFVWASGTATSSFANNSFTVRAQGGTHFYSAATGTTTGVDLPSGGGAWGNLCDVNQKRLHGVVNTSDVLQKVSALPLYNWSYKTQDERIQHIGPTAQDFHATFGLGDNNTTISTLDPAGVTLAAVQELAKQLEAIRQENTELKLALRQLQEMARNE